MQYKSRLRRDERNPIPGTGSAIPEASSGQVVPQGDAANMCDATKALSALNCRAHKNQITLFYVAKGQEFCVYVVMLLYEASVH